MPPRHGKSFLASQYFPAWYVGTYPDRRVILTSYEARFAASWGRKARNLMEEHGQECFGVNVADDSHAADAWAIQGHEGGMITAGAGGPITGRGANLLICDDPIKNYEEAKSATIRQNVWDWWQSTAYTRLEPDAAVVVIQTRWHEDDLAGRLLAEAAGGGEQWELINFPAIAEESDVLGRNPGDPLWPQRYDEAALARIQQGVGPQVWAALYQQHPSPPEGIMFLRRWFRAMPQAPRQGWTRLVRGWDFNYSEGRGDWTVGVLIGVRPSLIPGVREEVWVLDVVRGQWGSGRRDDAMSLTAMQDDADYPGQVQIWFPQDPAAGKDTAERVLQLLKGYRVYATPIVKNKEAAADGFRSHCWAEDHAGRQVYLLQAPWNKAWLDEFCMFPNSAHDDQVDASSVAFNKVIKAGKGWAVGTGTGR